jgi:hypothetical protein
MGNFCIKCKTASKARKHFTTTQYVGKLIITLTWALMGLQKPNLKKSTHVCEYVYTHTSILSAYGTSWSVNIWEYKYLLLWNGFLFLDSFPIALLLLTAIFKMENSKLFSNVFYLFLTYINFTYFVTPFLPCSEVFYFLAIRFTVVRDHELRRIFSNIKGPLSISVL